LISNKRNLKLFEKIINFSIDTKRRKLKNIMESYEEGRTESGQGYRRALVVARSLTKQNKFFTSKQLANKLSICVRSATKYIKKMIENKDIIKIEGWKYATNTD
jgi:Fic family protein